MTAISAEMQQAYVRLCLRGHSEGREAITTLARDAGFADDVPPLILADWYEEQAPLHCLAYPVGERDDYGVPIAHALRTWARNARFVGDGGKWVTPRC